MSLFRSASTVSLFTLASRITGLMRELLVASFFGASAATDAFNVAFRIPNLLRRLFAEGAFSQAFVPILTETKTQAGNEATRELVHAVAIVLFWTLLIVCILGIIGAPLLVWLMAAGLKQSGGFDAATMMTRIMFPYIGCMSLVALCAGVLNTWGRFALPAFTPVILNICVIAAAFFLAPWLKNHAIPAIYALAIGVMVGGVLQLVIMWRALGKLHLAPTLTCQLDAFKQNYRHAGVKRILRQMAPALLGVSVAQLSLLINTQIASHMGTGAVSWLTYADRLMEFPTAMLGVALGVVLLPKLSAAQAQQDTAGFSSLLDWGLRLVMLLAFPSALALLLFAEPLVSVLYHYGHFSALDVHQTTVAVMGYGVGLLGLIGIKILAPGYYAKLDTKTPVRIAIVVLVITQLLNMVFVPIFQHAGLALSIGLGAVINASWLLVGLIKRGSYRPLAGWAGFMLRIGLAAGLMAVGLYWANQHFDWAGTLHNHPFQRILLLSACLLSALGVYFSCLTLSGLKLQSFLKR